MTNANKYWYLWSTLFVTIIFSSGAHGQVENIDYWIHEATHVKALNEKDRVKELDNWLRAFNLSQSDPAHYRMSKICTTIGDIFADNGLNEKALYYYKYILSDNNNDLIKSDDDIELIRKIAQAFSSSGNPDSAYFYYEQIFDEFLYPERIDILRDIVKIYTANNHHRNALEYNIKIKELLESNNAGAAELSKVYNNIGYNYHFINQYDLAIDHYENARELLPSDSNIDQVAILINLGISHFNLGNYEKSIYYLLLAKKIPNESTENGEIDQLLATVYFKNSDLFNGLSYTQSAEKLAKATTNFQLLGDIYYGYAQLYAKMFEYDRALLYFQKHLTIRDSLTSIERNKQNALLQSQGEFSVLEKEIEILKRQKENGDLYIETIELEASKAALALKAARLNDTLQANELALLLREKELKDAEFVTQGLEAETAIQQLRLTRQNLEAVQSQQEITSLNQKKQQLEFAGREQEAVLRDEQNKGQLLRQENEISQIKINQGKVNQQNLIIGAALLAALLLALYFLYRNKNRDHSRLTVAYDNLEVAQVQLRAAETRITGLLKQQVSGAVAQALMTNTDSQKVERRFVCIMFLDIRNFTGFAESRKPEEIIAFQNSVFGFMINIIEMRHGVVNQLLGDGFMATFGAPISTGNDSQNAYLAAREIIATLKTKVASGDVIPTKIGIGLHAGFVVTGNVGNEERKQYSITGNTVILAARLEQLNKEYGTSLVISKDVYDQLPENDREPIDFKEVMVKGRSKPIAVASFN